MYSSYGGKGDIFDIHYVSIHLLIERLPFKEILLNFLSFVRQHQKYCVVLADLFTVVEWGGVLHLVGRDGGRRWSPWRNTVLQGGGRQWRNTEKHRLAR